jgi:dihydrofolate reductase
MIRSLIVAMSSNRVIGHANGLPWRLPADMAHFKRLTMGHPIVMGRLTYESIGKPLPGRRNIVVSRTAGLTLPGCTVVPSLDEAYRAAGDVDEVFVIGGAQLYESALASADRIYLTQVEAEIPGDTLFPPLDPKSWQEVETARQAPDERHAHALRFVRLERRR